MVNCSHSCCVSSILQPMWPLSLRRRAWGKKNPLQYFYNFNWNTLLFIGESRCFTCHLFSQSAYTYIIGSSYCAGLDPKVGASLVPPKGVQLLKSLLVPVVQTRLKEANSAKSYRNFEFLGCVTKLLTIFNMLWI